MKTKPAQTRPQFALTTLPRTRSIAMCAVLALLLGYQSWQRCYVFEGPRELWTDTLEKNPGAIIAYDYLIHLAVNSEEKRRLSDRAVLAFREAESGRRLTVAEQAEFGAMLLTIGQLAEAERRLTDAIERGPVELDVKRNALANLGIALLARKNFARSEQLLQESLALDPASDRANYGMGYLRGEQLRYAESEAFFRTAIQANPTMAEAAKGIGVMCFNRGDRQQARIWFERAYQMEPTQEHLNYLQQVGGD